MNSIDHQKLCPSSSFYLTFFLCHSQWRGVMTQFLQSCFSCSRVFSPILWIYFSYKILDFPHGLLPAGQASFYHLPGFPVLTYSRNMAIPLRLPFLQGSFQCRNFQDILNPFIFYIFSYFYFYLTLLVCGDTARRT